MGCTKIGHCHQWPTSGNLTIQRCETRCNFCDDEQGKKDWKYAWFLRRHVRAVHVKRGHYPDLDVDVGWDESARKHKKKKTLFPSGRRSIRFKDESPASFQPLVHDGEYHDRFMDSFGEPITALDHEGNIDDLTSLEIDAYAMSVNNVRFRSEYPTSMDNQQWNSQNEFESWIDSFVDDCNYYPEGVDEVGMIGSDPALFTIDPRLTQYRNGIDTDQNSCTNLTTDEAVISSTGQNNEQEGQDHRLADSDIAAARFFMRDYELPNQDAIDEMPLVDVSQNHLHSAHPDFGEYWNTLSGNINRTTEQMRREGIDVEAIQTTISLLTTFAQCLQECKQPGQ